MFKDLKSTSSLKPVKEESAQNEVALIVLEAADPKLANKKISFQVKSLSVEVKKMILY